MANSFTKSLLLLYFWWLKLYYVFTVFPIACNFYEVTRNFFFFMLKIYACQFLNIICFKYRTRKAENTIQKYCHIYEFPHTYGSILFFMAASLSGKLLDSCRLLGLMQTIHTSAVGCCFHRITCYFFQNCSCNIFLSVAWHIIHLQFHFSVKVYLILQLIPF